MVSSSPLQYFLVLRRKNKVVQARSLNVCCWSVPPWWAASRASRAETGIGQNHVSGGWRLAYVSSCWPNQKLILPNVLCLGLLVPTAANICLMEQRYSSTDLFLMGVSLDARRPARTRLAKILRKGVGSPMPWRSAGISRHLQNLRHWHQVVESFWETVADNPRDSTCCVAWKSAAACTLTEG